MYILLFYILFINIFFITKLFVYLLEIMLKYLVIPLINITLRMHKNKYCLELCKVNIINDSIYDPEDNLTDESDKSDD